MSATSGLRYALRKDVAIEDFGGRSLALRCDVLELREINAGGRKILERVDGKRTVADIARATDMAAEEVAAALREMERQFLEQVLAECHGNKSAAAKTLKMHRRTLQRKLARSA